MSSVAGNKISLYSVILNISKSWMGTHGCGQNIPDTYRFKTCQQHKSVNGDCRLSNELCKLLCIKKCKYTVVYSKHMSKMEILLHSVHSQLRENEKIHAWERIDENPCIIIEKKNIYIYIFIQ